MGYSIKDTGECRTKQGTEFNYFTDKEWESYPFASAENIKWFAEARYGLFLHVGISAVGKVDISWPRATRKMPDPQNTGIIPDSIYDGWSKQIKFSRFNAHEWATIAVKSGFKYVVIIAKHHDGFHMWDTAYSDYKITNAPFGRDYLRELTDAMREAGLKIGIYYSKRDWKHPDYEPVPTADAVALKTTPFFKMTGKPHYITEKHKKYQEYMFNTVRELMTNYGKIDLLWWDAEYNAGMFLKEMWRSEELEKMVRSLQPHIVINNRSSLPGDFDTPEGHTGFFQNTRFWETCMPLGQHWAYSDSPIKSVKKLLKQLLNCAGGDGNYLLSIGCKPDGSIAQNEEKRMTEIGEWLGKYGGGVYGTRGGIWKPTRKYVSCYKENAVYLYVFGSTLWNALSLPLSNNNIVSLECLSGDKIKYSVLQDKLTLRVKLSGKTSPVAVIKIVTADMPVME